MGGRASCLTKEEHDSHGDSPFLPSLPPRIPRERATKISFRIRRIYIYIYKYICIRAMPDDLLRCIVHICKDLG